jgi:hypothetical protein
MSIQSVGDWTATNDTLLDESTGSTNNNNNWWEIQSNSIPLDNYNPCDFPDIIVEKKYGDIVETDDDSSIMVDSFSSVTTVAIFEDDNEDDEDDDVEQPLSDELLLLISNEPKSSIDDSNEKNGKDKDRWCTTKRGDITIGTNNWTDPIDDDIIEEKNGDNAVMDHDASNVMRRYFSPTTIAMFNDVGKEQEEEEEEEEVISSVICLSEDLLLNNNETKIDEGTFNAQNQSIVKMLENPDDAEDLSDLKLKLNEEVGIDDDYDDYDKKESSLEVVKCLLYELEEGKEIEEGLGEDCDT